jgi:prevent-host-death family protein
MAGMASVSIRDLRNRGREVMERVEAGESFTVTRDGRPVAQLLPLRRRPLDLDTLLARRRNLPHVDPDALRRDLDNIIDPSL